MDKYNFSTGSDCEECERLQEQVDEHAARIVLLEDERDALRDERDALRSGLAEMREQVEALASVPSHPHLSWYVSRAAVLELLKKLE